MRRSSHSWSITMATRFRHPRRARAAGVTAALLAALIGLGAATTASAEVQAYAGVVGGQAQGSGSPFACATSGPTIGDGWFAGIALPTEGFAACHLSGGIDNQVAAGGTLTAAQSVTAPVGGGGSFTGHADANATYGKLGVSASGTMNGTTSSSIYHQAASFARFQDTWTFTAPGIATGTAGTLNLGFLVEGSMSSSPHAPSTQQVDLLLGMRFNGSKGGPWDSFMATIVNDNEPYLRDGGTWAPGSFTTSPGAFSGSGLVTSTGNFEFQWGVPIDVEVAFRTQLSPCCINASLASDFLGTALLKGIYTTAAGQTITSFNVASASGTAYGPEGLLAAAVPEPGGWALMLAGVAGLIARRRFRPSRP
ncbi:hypothetical protein CDL60_07945 [Roseateles noduli]|nr:hypothetical protein CDL60_07945 [Roseateles noduli]